MIMLTIPAMHSQNIDYLQKAKEFLSQGDCERARLAYDDYVKNHPNGNAEVKRQIDACGEDLSRFVPEGYVDLGLPSGTLWKDKNESGFYDYDAAVQKFGNKLPTKGQLQELVTKCQWTWTGSGYKVVGPNGKSIYLPAAGYRYCDGDVDVGSCGVYWSSTPLGSDFAWYLGFNSGGVYMYNYNRCDGRSVRLVQD